MDVEQSFALQDAKTSNDFMRGACQAAILINGGAATATMAFLNSNISKNIATAIIPASLAIYAFGVFMSAFALSVGSNAIERWMTSHLATGQAKRENEVSAERAWKNTLKLTRGSLFCFVLASFVFAAGLFFRK